MPTSSISTNALFPSATSAPPSVTSARDSAAAADFNSFLTLLTAQLRNQDPLTPLDSTQFVEQLASFSAVEQQIQTNTLLEQFVQGFGQNGLADQASQWIGRTVEAAPDSIVFRGDPVEILAPAASTAAERRIVIRDDSGREVFSQPIPSTATAFEWPGVDNGGLIAPLGAYQATIETSRADDNAPIVEPARVASRVTEARLVDGVVRLFLENGASVDPARIAAVRDSAAS